MAHLVEDITKYFVFEDIDIDNYHFKLYSKGCVILFFAGSMVGVMSQYFGEPIQCDFKGVDTETAKDYCWIHGSSYIPPQYQRHMKCIADLEGIDRKEDAPDTSYYQWVTFMMLLQAGLFMVPPKIWRSMEGGLLDSFGMEGKSVVMLTDEAKYEDGVVMTVIIEKFVKYFTMILHHNQKYFTSFVMCEMLNMVLLFFNFWAVDQFLQGRFRYYGYQVVVFYQMNSTEQAGSVNPFCAAFPKEVSCDVPTVGASGREQWHNGFCVLSQNVINEKIYLALWFYLVFTMVCCLVFMFYRTATIFVEPLRFYIIYWRVGHSYDDDIRHSLKYVLSRCYIGDWFVLQQLSRNVNIYFYREFIKELRQAMKATPKMAMRHCTFDYDKDEKKRKKNKRGSKKEQQLRRRRVKEKERLDRATEERLNHNWNVLDKLLEGEEQQAERPPSLEEGGAGGRIPSAPPPPPPPPPPRPQRGEMVGLRTFAEDNGDSIV